MMEAFAILIVVCLLVQTLTQTFFLVFNFYAYSEEETFERPRVSILIPCRNEEKNLPKCLYSLNKLNYPLEKLEIVLGDDRSTDRTMAILKDWQRHKSHVRLLSIKEGDTKRMNGKANALAQMCHECSGEILLFTDADCQVPTEWVNSMVRARAATQAGIVTGITQVLSRGIFSRMQGMDWWLTLGMVKVVSDWGEPVTAMGNNMLISRNAYEAVGGFEGIPFSLTEDFEIEKAIRASGFVSIHLVSDQNLVLTKPISDYGKLMQQRKRWIHGAMQLPAFWKLLLGLQVAFFPAIVFLVFLHPFEGSALWLFKVAIQGVFIYLFAAKTNTKLKIVDFLWFEIYYLITAWSTIVYYFWPSKTDWKGRKYA